MNRLLFSRAADADFDEISVYLNSLPVRPALRIAREIQKALYLIARYPYQGQAHSSYTQLLGQEVRSRVAGSYRIFYRPNKTIPEIIAILHGARDQAAIMAQRLT